MHVSKKFDMLAASSICEVIVSLQKFKNIINVYK